MFFEKLQSRNTRTKNLTTSFDFKRFRRQGKGRYYVFFVHDLFLYSNFTDFKFEEEEEVPPTMAVLAQPLPRPTMAVSTPPPPQASDVEAQRDEPELDEGIDMDDIKTEPPGDLFEEVKKYIQEFDYEMEAFDWECFEQDIDDIEQMDFTRYA